MQTNAVFPLHGTVLLDSTRFKPGIRFFFKSFQKQLNKMSAIVGRSFVHFLN